jgi:hypothetical protein
MSEFRGSDRNRSCFTCIRIRKLMYERIIEASANNASQSGMVANFVRIRGSK